MSLTDYIDQRIDSLREGIKDWTREMIRAWVANLLTSTTVARASESDDDPLHDDADGWSSSDDMTTSNAEGGENSRPRVRRMEAPCFAYVPVEKEPMKTAGIGANLLGFPVSSTRYRPKGMKQSEAAMYNLAALAAQGVIKIDKNGNITVTAPADKAATVSAGGATAKLTNAGLIELTSRGGAKIVMNADTLATTLLRATHFGGNLAAVPPTAAPGAALAGGTATCIGNDAAFLVSMVVNAPGGASGALCTITFGTRYDSPPQFSITAASPALIVAGVVPVGMGAVRGQATAATLDIITDQPISTGPLLLSVLVKQ